MNNYDDYDYSEDFSPEELHEKKQPKEYQTLEEQLRDVGMSIHDFI